MRRTLILVNLDIADSVLFRNNISYPTVFPGDTLARRLMLIYAFSQEFGSF